MVVSGKEQRRSVIHTHVFILSPTPSHQGWHITWVELHVLYSRSLLVIHFKYSSVYMTFPNSLTIPSSHLFPHPFPLDKLNFFSLLFLFCIGVQAWLYNVVIVSDGQQRHSAIHIHVSILPQTPLPSRLPHNTEQTSLCYTGGPFWSFIWHSKFCGKSTTIIALTKSQLHPTHGCR